MLFNKYYFIYHESRHSGIGINLITKEQFMYNFKETGEIIFSAILNSKLDYIIKLPLMQEIILSFDIEPNNIIYYIDFFTDLNINKNTNYYYAILKFINSEFNHKFIK